LRCAARARGDRHLGPRLGPGGRRVGAGGGGRLSRGHVRRDHGGQRAAEHQAARRPGEGTRVARHMAAVGAVEPRADRRGRRRDGAGGRRAALSGRPRPSGSGTIDPVPALDFHRTLPGYAPTPLRDVAELADELGVGRVLVKEEAGRLGLPSFKVLGASYAAARALARRFGAADLTLDAVRAAVRGHDVRLYAATDGNHGRAVAHVAGLVGAAATVYLPRGVTAQAVAAVAGE